MRLRSSGLHAAWFRQKQQITGGEITGNNLFSWTFNELQPLSVLFGSSTVPDNNEWCENALHCSSVWLARLSFYSCLRKNIICLAFFSMCVNVPLEAHGYWNRGTYMTWLYNCYCAVGCEEWRNGWMGSPEIYYRERVFSSRLFWVHKVVSHVAFCRKTPIMDQVNDSYVIFNFRNLKKKSWK